MTNKIARQIELFANTSIIVVAILVSSVLVKYYLLPPRVQWSGNSVLTHGQVQAGTKISLTDMNWAKNGQTLLLAISSTCHFCSDSAPFYQRLVRERGDARLIAILPQSTSEGQKYLSQIGVSVDEVRQVVFDSIGVTSTPTLILVNDKGVATNVWVGQLPDNQENDVLAQIRRKPES